MQISSMRVDGGGTASRFLMQFQADLLGIPVEIPAIRETTALGSAYLAALGLGELSRIEDTVDLWRCQKRYEPAMSEDHRAALMDQWAPSGGAIQGLGSCRMLDKFLLVWYIHFIPE